MNERHRYCLFQGVTGTGKSTVAYKIAQQRGIGYLSVSHMLKTAVEKNTHAGKKVKILQEQSQLVTDDLILEVMREIINSKECKNGFILDGYPKTISQALKMDQMLKQEGKSINHVYNFVVSNERILFDRLSTTRIHTASGRIYTKTHPPRIEGKDDKTGETLDIFEEDSEKSVRKRLQAHKLFTVALIDHYRKKGIVTDTDASGSLESIYEQIVQFLPEKVPWYESLKSVLWLGEGIGKAISPVLFYEGFYFAKRVLSLVSFGKL